MRKLVSNVGILSVGSEQAFASLLQPWEVGGLSARGGQARHAFTSVLGYCERSEHQTKLVVDQITNERPTVRPALAGVALPLRRLPALAAVAVVEYDLFSYGWCLLLVSGHRPYSRIV